MKLSTLSLCILALSVCITREGTSQDSMVMDQDEGSHQKRKSDNSTKLKKIPPSLKAYLDKRKKERTHSQKTRTPAEPDAPSMSTNTSPIVVTYHGTHFGQKLVKGVPTPVPGQPVGYLACGNPEKVPLNVPHEETKTDDYTVYAIPSDGTKSFTIPAGSVQTVKGDYYKLDDQGHFIRDGRQFESERGQMMKCTYSMVGQGGFLGNLSADLKSIDLYDKDNGTGGPSFSY